MFDNLKELAATMQGLIFALTLLDTYPATERKLTPAIHALHNALEKDVGALCEVLDAMEME